MQRTGTWRISRPQTGTGRPVKRFGNRGSGARVGGGSAGRFGRAGARSGEGSRRFQRRAQSRQAQTRFPRMTAPSRPARRRPRGRRGAAQPQRRGVSRFRRSRSPEGVGGALKALAGRGARSARKSGRSRKSGLLGLAGAAAGIAAVVRQRRRAGHDTRGPAEGQSGETPTAGSQTAAAPPPADTA